MLKNFIDLHMKLFFRFIKLFFSNLYRMKSYIMLQPKECKLININTYLMLNKEPIEPWEGLQRDYHHFLLLEKIYSSAITQMAGGTPACHKPLKTIVVK